MATELIGQTPGAWAPARARRRADHGRSAAKLHAAVVAAACLVGARRRSPRLAYLARRLEGAGAVLAVGVRTAELATDPAMIGEVASVAAAADLRPRPLGEASVAALIRARLHAEPDPAFTAACLTPGAATRCLSASS